MGSTISSIPIIGQSPIGAIIGAITGGNKSSSSTNTNVTVGTPLNIEPAIYVQNPKVTYDPNRANAATTTTSSSSSIFEDFDATTALYLAGGITVIILLLK